MNYLLSLKQSMFQFFQVVLVVILIVLITILIEKLIKRSFHKKIRKSNDIVHHPPAQYNFLMYLITALIYLAGLAMVVYAIPPLRHLSFSIFASSGILAAVIGFASQHSIANIVSGIFITIFKPFVVGDRVKMMSKDITGVVEDITLRHTIIRTFKNKRVIIPNSVISTEVIENANIVDEKVCKFIEMSISYDSDINKAMEIMRDEAMKHPDMIENRDEDQVAKNDPIVDVRVIGFGDSSVNLRAWVWSRDSHVAFKMGCDLYKSIKERFDKESIEIPFPYRTIVYKNKIDK